MDSDDIAPPPRSGDPLNAVIAQDLDPFSVTELEARIATLEAEVARTQSRLARTVDDRASADAIFRR